MSDVVAALEARHLSERTFKVRTTAAKHCDGMVSLR
jgi:hypothetical protein